MIRNISILMLTVFGMSATTVTAQNPEAPELDRLFDILEREDKFMGSMSVYREGGEIFKKSVGFTDTVNRVPANEKSLYCIGSITKSFTAVMILQAVEEGRLSLSRTLDAYFPLIANSREITIAHLLGHRSGIRNFIDEHFLDWHTQKKTKDQMVELIINGGNDFSPDSMAQYSNSNYVLLSYILEAVYGKSYAEILEDKITGPLSLERTYYGENDNCNSYNYSDGWIIHPKTDPSITIGAGGIISTPGELNQFANALFSGKLVSSESLSVMQKFEDGYGMGLFPIPFHSVQGYGHHGGIDGYQAMLIYFPADKISYAVTSNGLNYSLSEINHAVLSWVYGMPFDMPSPEAN